MTDEHIPLTPKPIDPKTAKLLPVVDWAKQHGYEYEHFHMDYEEQGPLESVHIRWSDWGNTLTFSMCGPEIVSSTMYIHKRGGKLFTSNILFPVEQLEEKLKKLK